MMTPGNVPLSPLQMRLQLHRNSVAGSWNKSVRVWLCTLLKQTHGSYLR
jgi:hypothetical protein